MGTELESLEKLAALIRREREPLLSEWRTQVRQLRSAHNLDTPTLDDHIPALLDELTRAFDSVAEATIPEALLEGTPPAHGLQRQVDGFDIVEVVAEYNVLRGCIHDLADAHGLSLRGQAFHILNRLLDEAIGLAVQTYATGQALEVQRRREEYLAFVAHDLRTPLSAISLAASMLDVTEGDDAVRSARMLKTLHRNVQHLEALVGKVLKESAHVADAGAKLERRRFDLWPLVEALLHDMRPLADTPGTQLVNHVPEELSVYGDASLLRRVLQNLIANAIKYSPRGRVEIGAQETGVDGSTECWVTDNGEGIPEDRLEVIFEKLETDAQNEGGTGLGLAIVKTFIEAHGGQVTVQSKRGIGSTFRFTLPGGAAG